MPTDKALGPDMISDRWMRRKENSMLIHKWVEKWINGEEKLPKWINDGNLMLIEKNGPKSIRNTRPIVCSNFSRKLLETAWLRLYGKILWQTVHQRQIGFRPGGLMVRNTAELIQEMNTGKHKAVLYVDLKGAFPSVH